ncbi:MAG TPA: hypothetical protein VKU02_33475 [Gemmataceae bacterium]|nr:hypothetical protein [Gemmataceae bacterium]
MSPEAYGPELASLAQALTGLSPCAGRLDRDQVLFRAGRASAGQQSRRWRTIAAGLAALAAVVGWGRFLSPAPQRIQCIVYQRAEPAASAVDHLVAQQRPLQDGTSPAAEDAGLQTDLLSNGRLERFVFAWGADAIPAPAATLGARQRDPLSGPRDLFSWNQWLRMQPP